MQVILDPHSVDSYRTFKQIKLLPAWSMRGRVATFPDEYADRLGLNPVFDKCDYKPESFLFDYQRDIVQTAIERRKFAIFADCGLGKTLMILSWAQHVRNQTNGRVLIVTPPLVVRQMIGECDKFWGDSLPVEQVKAANLAEWLQTDGDAVGITNWEALKADLPQGNLAALALDESSMLKSHYGTYATRALDLGRGLDYKLCATGTPAPNDRIEYANHAVFLDRFPTTNSFLAKYFVNRGQTGERWEIKPHAVKPFYRALSDWCIFLSDPSVYGWQDNSEGLPPINVHFHDVPLTDEQRNWVQQEHGTLMAIRSGGITQRAGFGQVSKGFYRGQEYPTHKYEFMADLVNGWRKKESTLVWCLYDDEQKRCQDSIGGHSMSGSTKMATRLEMIDEFKNGEVDTLISKPRILGFGLNLQKATRQVFSGLQDSYESYYQCVKRSNRIGSTRPLHVHIPATDLEMPMIENVIRKAHRVEQDTREQEQLFKELSGA